MRVGEKIRLPRGALARLRKADAALGRAIDDVGRFKMERRVGRNGLEALTRSIVYQQISGKAAATIYGRFLELYPPEEFPSPEHILSTHHARLRKAGLSRQKQAALRDLCRHVASGRLPLHDCHELEDDALIERLTAVRGIGRWSAHMFMMFHLARLDIWPVDDLGVQKALQRLKGLREKPSPKKMAVLGEPYRPYRSVAAWYLWRSLDGEAQL